MEKYALLFDEVRAINMHLGTVGVLDALQYIDQYEEEYRGTQVHRQFRAFMREGARMFAEVE